MTICLNLLEVERWKICSHGCLMLKSEMQTTLVLLRCVPTFHTSSYIFQWHKWFLAFVTARLSSILYLLLQKELIWSLAFFSFLWNRTGHHWWGKFRAPVSEREQLGCEWGNRTLSFLFLTRMCWKEVHLLTFICVMWMGRSKVILFIFRNPVVFQQMSTHINTRHKARNFPYLEVQNKQQIEDRFGWVFQSPDIPGRFRSSLAGVKPHTMLTLSSHSRACVLAIGEKDAGSSEGADTAASGKTKNIPLWTTDVCLSCLPRGILPWTWDRPQLSAILCQRPQPPPWEHAADMQDDVLLISLPLSH